jgi:hypothetical protein
MHTGRLFDKMNWIYSDYSPYTVEQSIIIQRLSNKQRLVGLKISFFLARRIHNLYMRLVS